MRIHKRAAGVPGIDRCVRLDKIARLARIVRVRIGTVERAHNAARDGKLEVTEGAAEGKHRLAGMKTRRVAPGNTGQVLGVDADHGQIVQLVHTHQLRRKYAAVVQRDSDLRCTIHHVAIRYDVAVRRNDDAAADAVFHLLRLPAAAHVSLRSKELLKSGRQRARRNARRLAILLALVAVPARRHRHIHNRGRHASGHCFHCVVQRRQRRHAAFIHRRRCANGCVGHAVIECESKSEHGSHCANRNSGSLCFYY